MSYAAPLTEQHARRVVDSTHPPALLSRALWTPQTTESFIAEWKRLGDSRADLGSSSYPHPWSRYFDGRPENCSIGLKPRLTTTQVLDRQYEVAFCKDPWFAITGGDHNLDYADTVAAEWFLTFPRRVAPILRPDFGFADYWVTIARTNPPDPRRVAWPVMILGDPWLRAHGREHLLNTPAWRVEELPGGSGIWIQAAESAFEPTEDELRRVADHLGLEPRPEAARPTRGRAKPGGPADG